MTTDVEVFIYLQGWMNELYQYNPDDYSINHTHSVYVQLEGTKLRLQRPKINVPRRAMWDDTIPATTFLHQRHFDIEGSKVYLLPDGLVKKRLWSKKYPICIALAKTGRQSEKNLVVQASFDTESPSSYSPGHLPKSYSSDNLPRHKCKAKILYLFARTSREKEDWFRRLEGAATGCPLPTSLTKLLEQWEMTQKTKQRSRHPSTEIPTKNSSNQQSNESNSPSQKNAPAVMNIEPTQIGAPPSVDVPMLIRFMNYMGGIMPKEHKSNSNNEKIYVNGVPSEWDILSSCDPSVLWVNAVVGRLFWDFLNDDRWARFMSDKLQKKMAKIHVSIFAD